MTTDDIRQAKVEAAERVIEDRLRAMGLSPQDSDELARLGANALRLEAQPTLTYSDKPWFFCAHGEHDLCDQKVLLPGNKLERCPCECHQTTQQPPQPAPDGGEWRVGGKFVSDCEETLSGMYAVYGEDGRFIAGFSDKEEAAQIVAEHNAVPKLVEALKGVAIMLNTELERYESEPWAQRVREALTTTTQPDAGEGR